ncbi:MFS transporter [Ktedonosporobacter rubrisoli]|uniref:MFS transporter n=1 Tax=Ktedonosporobacter rubrisoli TaxID=2509675 RepID=A0A4P6JVP3_KTERU|nr:MFS transporter [Ktedonosporobacter rubrisoli]QBD79738.1 MFS transporter [Ktedonosporobacter rubrisoli]
MTSQLLERQPSAALPEEPAAGTPGPWQVLKNRNFLLIWIAQLLSLITLNAANFGFVMQVQHTSSSLLLVSLAIIAFQLPAFPFGAIAGVIVDWLDKRLVLWVSNILRMATMLLMSLSLLIDHTNLGPLFVLTFLTALIGQFFTPAEGASIPFLVEKRELMAALSLFNITVTVSMVIGFLLLGGLIIQLFPPFTIQLSLFTLHIEPTDLLFLFGALLYGICAILILCIPRRAFGQASSQAISNKQLRESSKQAISQLRHDMIEGWLMVRTNRLLFFAVIQCTLIGIVMLLVGLLAPTFVQHILQRRAEDVSLILAPAGIGLVGAACVLPRLTQRIDKLVLTTIGLSSLALGCLLLALNQWFAHTLNPAQATSWLTTSTMILVAVLGAAIAMVTIPTQTLMIECAPEAGRARVLALQFMLYNLGSIPVLLFAALIAQFIGFDRFLILLAASIALFGFWSYRTMRRQRRQKNQARAPRS